MTQTSLSASHDERFARRLPAPVKPLRIETDEADWDEMVGQSPALREVVRQVEQVSATDATVLIHGETGTGKELIARAIHRGSDRVRGPFVKLNAAAIPAAMLESELFGHERGAFTGAIDRRVGRFEQAQNGTIFFDEIGELELDLQPKMLRVLQEREFERLGGSHTVRSNARLVAATNRDLAGLVACRAFRADLYYRLNVFPIHLPPLRARRDDIPLLAQHFIRQLARRFGKDIRAICPASLKQMERYHWPGNIRELQNVLERAAIMSTGPIVQVGLPAAICHSARLPDADALEQVDRAHILSILDRTNWVVAGPDGAAALLGMKRTTLNFRMKKLGIKRRSA
jgi:formate hydrogenlyase transcriptional activator